MLFQHEDFIILGMLFAKYFSAYIYNFGSGIWGGGSWTGGGFGWVPDEIQHGTGRGGIVTINSNTDGEDGRPGVNDNATSPAVPSLSGGKGTTTSPGQGYIAGQFGFGGNASSSGLSISASAGGGSGWFGGGSSYMDAGGGGGSSFCLSFNPLSLTSIKAVGAITGRKYTPPSWLEPGQWVGIDSDTLSHYNLNEALYTTNCKHLREYEKYRLLLGTAFSDYIRLRERANGNGLILISNPDEMIRIDKTSGILGIAEVIEYTGTVKEWTPPIEGDYHFILWGAQGGTVLYTEPGQMGLTFQQYTGGFGGASSGVFHLSPTHKEINEQGEEVDIDTHLYLYVGQEGFNSGTIFRAWNGGGNAGRSTTGGGGATDIRWSGADGATTWQGNLYDRLIVAGGGGGCVGVGNGGDNPEPPFTEGKPGDTEQGGDKGKIDIPGDDKIPYFLVNDQSLVYVTFKYFTQSSLPEDYDLNCTLYINGGKEGVLYKSFSINPASGVVELVYELDQVYPPNTPTHWVTLTAQVETNIMFIVPEGGMQIRVETRARPNEPNSDLDPNKRPIFLRLLEGLKLRDIYSINFKSKPGDLKTSVNETFDIIDTYGVYLKAVKLLNIKTIESLGSLTDSQGVEIEGPEPPPSDILIAKLEGLNLIDKAKIIAEKIRVDNRESLESFSFTDSLQISIKAVKLLNIKTIESLGSLTDSQNIKEEAL